MGNSEEEKSLKFLMDTWGYDSQRLICIEECAELIQALCHESRGRENGKIEELADAELAIRQMKLYLTPSQLSKLEEIKKFKIERAVKKAIKFLEKK